MIPSKLAMIAAIRNRSQKIAAVPAQPGQDPMAVGMTPDAMGASAGMPGGMPPGGMPMDPSMMGGMPGGMPPGMPPGMPMDPAMMGGAGAPPMDPAMMGGAGGMPMDPAMMQGLPPEAVGAGAPPPPQPVQLTLEDLKAVLDLAVKEKGGGDAEEAQGGKARVTNRELGDKLDVLSDMLGTLLAALGVQPPEQPAEGLGAGMPVPAEAEAAGLPPEAAGAGLGMGELADATGAAPAGEMPPPAGAGEMPPPAGMPKTAKAKSSPKVDLILGRLARSL